MFYVENFLSTDLIAGEAIYNIGTVASMNQERKIFKNYNAALQAPAK